MDTVEPGSGAGDERARSAEEADEYVQQIRSLPVERIIGDVLFSMLNAAQIKLGRRDARLLIDLSAVAQEHVRSYLPDELAKQIDQALGQLRLGQVSAEGHVNRQGKPEENDLSRVPAPPSAPAPQPPPGPPPSRLWVPGR